MTLWLTRPQEDSAAMAAELAARGVKTIICPVMQIQPVACVLPESTPDALVLTSRHAASAIAPRWRDVPVYCVGAATADAVRAQGCTRVFMGEGSALALLPLLRAQQSPGHQLVHLGGAEVKIDLAPLLAVDAMHLTRYVVYDALATEPSAAFMQAWHAGAITGAVFYSPRSARIAAQWLAADAAPLAQADAYCLSLDVAAAAAALPFRRLLSCPVPTHQAMMELLSQAAITTA